MTDRKIISVDFDGVLHHYASWKGATVIDGPPVPGAIEWLVSVIEDERFEVHVFSSRSKSNAGRSAMWDWVESRILEHWREHRGGDSNQAFELSDCIQWPARKPPAHISVDDRGWRYEGGAFPDLDAMADFRPWWKP